MLPWWGLVAGEPTLWWFFQSHVWMWEMEHKQSWAPKNWCFWTVVLEKTLENLLDCKEIQPVHRKRDQSWIFIGRADAEALVLWPPDAKKWLTGKDPDAGQDWRQEEKGTTNEMVGWHHRLDGPEFEEAPGVGDRQGSLACCSPWGRKELDTTEWLNWTEPYDKRAGSCNPTPLLTSRGGEKWRLNQSLASGRTTSLDILYNNLTVECYKELRSSPLLMFVLKQGLNSSPLLDMREVPEKSQLLSNF